MSNVLIAFTPRLNREFDLHATSIPIEAGVRNYRFAVRGRDFKSALTNPLAGPRRRLPGGECVELGVLLSAALAELHRVGLIHRDIKGMSAG